jgi:hypothetical protein
MMTDSVNIVKNEKGKVITAELSYAPSGMNSFSNNGRPSTGAKYTGTQVKKMLANHVSNASQLRDMSDYLYNSNGIYRRLIDTAKNLVSYENVITPLTPQKVNFKKYQTNYAKVKEYLWDCNLEATLDDIFFKLGKYGRYSAYDRGTYLQPLPLDYTRIIGISKDGNSIIQFNFQYFEQFSNMRERKLQLDGFDPIFKKMYMDYKRGVDNPKVNFESDLNWRTLPHEFTYTFKIGSNMDSKEGMGMLYGSVDDILFYEEIRDLDRAVISSQRRKIIVQQLPVDKNGDSILGEEEIRQAHENLKSLLPPNVGCLTVLGGTKFDDIPLQLSALEKGKMKEVQDDVLMGSGIGEGALKGGNFSTGVLNIEVITNTLLKILKQIESIWFNRKFKKLTDSNYRFKLKFLGITSMNREDIIKSFDGLLDKGGNLTASINARGFEVQEYMDILELENELGYKDKFKPLLTSFTATGKEPGAPEGSGEGGDNTDKSSENGSNNNPKPSN